MAVGSQMPELDRRVCPHPHINTPYNVGLNLTNMRTHLSKQPLPKGGFPVMAETTRKLAASTR